ncbi:MAG: glycerophosphodiester phosphodiesterase family protein [Planctomycetota bacterium]|nr:glycerophosphodiester phosphodiesterase family protein [Planctomycetota bacterium]
MSRVPHLVLSAYHSSLGRLRSVIPYSFAFKILDALCLTPLFSLGLRQLLAHYGKASVGNFEIASFLLTWPGITAILCGGTFLLATQYFELAGLQLLLADRSLDWSGGLRTAARQFHRLLILGMRQLVVYLALAIPFLAGIGILYWWFWSGSDLNGLIILRPREFWLGGGLACAVGGTYLIVAGRWFLGWLFAVPVMLFETGISVTGALVGSESLTAGKYIQLIRVLGAWLIVNFLISVIVLWGLDAGSEWLLGGLSVFGTVSFAALVLALYRQATSEPTDSSGVEEVATATHVPDRPIRRMSRGWLWVGGLATCLAVTLSGAREYVRSQRLDDRVEFTAHRAGATHAPENSVAAVKQAIADRAEWAEIDVQRTADGQLVVMHDIDLARSGGGKRRVDQATLAEIQALDLGVALKMPEFTGERIPTFAEFLDAAGKSIRLNVELKPHNRADEEPLTELVVAELKRRGLTGRTRICSQSYASIQFAKRQAPDLEIGFIAAKSVGDLARLEVDFLMVETKMATRELVDRAATRGITIHAWTVNDTKWVAPLVDAGVDNIITDDPATLRARLDEIRELGTADRILLRVREALRR